MRFPWSSAPRRVRHKPLLRVPFLGQDALLADLDAGLQAARAGSPQYVVLEGPPGGGKSALLAEFAAWRCTTPPVLLLQVNAGACLLAPEFYGYLFAALRRRCDKILETLYSDTRRVRRALAVTWDEAEFRSLLASTDWVALGDDEPRPRTPRDAPFARLLHIVGEHPWAVSAAMMLETLTRVTQTGGGTASWAQRWAGVLHAARRRGLPAGAVLVVLVDHPQARGPEDTGSESEWGALWRAFVEALSAAGVPALVVWAGPGEALPAVRQALPGAGRGRAYRLESLPDADYQHLLRRVLRALPRPYRERWQHQVLTAGTHLRLPAALLLATACVAALTEQQEVPEETLQALARADITVVVERLVQAIGQRCAGEGARQLLEVCAFLAPGQDFTVDDVMVMSDGEALPADSAAGYAALDTPLGYWVRYGLVHYDAHARRYTAGSSVIQEALQRVACPAEAARRRMRRQRRLTAAVLYHLQHGERETLVELARLIAGQGEDVVPLTVALSAAMSRLLKARSKTERQAMAVALAHFPSPLAARLLMPMLDDEEGQVRSRAVQALADLQGMETVPMLIETLQDRDSDVRWIAAQALGRIDDVQTVHALISLLTDEDKEVGRIAAVGLGHKGDGRAVPHLIAAARDSYPLLRESAALALGELADARALSALQGLLHDTNQQVRRSAEKALARLQGAS